MEIFDINQRRKLQYIILEGANVLYGGRLDIEIIWIIV